MGRQLAATRQQATSCLHGAALLLTIYRLPVYCTWSQTTHCASEVNGQLRTCHYHDSIQKATHAQPQNPCPPRQGVSR